MKIKPLHIILISALFFNCNNTEPKKTVQSQQPTPKKEQITLARPKPKKIKTLEEKEDHSLNYLKEKFSHVYEYKEEDYRGLVGLNFIKKETLGFYILTETLPCDTFYDGQANYSVNQPDSLTNVYTKTTETYVIDILVSKDSSEVEISYLDKETLGTDCVPITEKVLKRVQ